MILLCELTIYETYNEKQLRHNLTDTYGNYVQKRGGALLAILRIVAISFLALKSSERAGVLHLTSQFHEANKNTTILFYPSLLENQLKNTVKYSTFGHYFFRDVCTEKVIGIF